MSHFSSSAYVELTFFFLAEDGIRDRNVTGVQTCALPISSKIVMAATTKKLLTPPVRTTRTAQRSVLQLLKTPGYARAQFIRRLISAVLICAAVAVAIGGLRDNPEVAVFSRDIDAGQVLT